MYRASEHATFQWPAWAPEEVQQYLAHTGMGVSLRDLARARDCHASTMMRRIRRVEQQRDDPLVDAALRRMETQISQTAPQVQRRAMKELSSMVTNPATLNPLQEGARLDQDAARVLRRLCETGAVLAIAADMDMAVVVREGADGSSTRTAVVKQDVAQSIALRGWIENTNGPGRIMRYTITAAGREKVKDFLDALPEAQAAEFAEAPAKFDPGPSVWGGRTVTDETGIQRRVRYNLADSPLTALARRRDRDGAPFLSEDLVRSGERLREDFELAQMTPAISEGWETFLSDGTEPTPKPVASGFGPDAARERVMNALRDLGPGLSDVALRCCCFLEGLEACEQRMGWSARSGKVVLRIALQRLHRHYQETLDEDSQLIG